MPWYLRNPFFHLSAVFSVIAILLPSKSQAETYVFLVSIVCLVIGISIFTFIDIPRFTSNMKKTAEQIVRHQWDVKGISLLEANRFLLLDPGGWKQADKKYPPNEAGTAFLKLTSVDGVRHPVEIPFRQNHPSIDELRNLTYLDVVEFDLQKEALKCAADSDLCAYLTLRRSELKPST